MRKADRLPKFDRTTEDAKRDPMGTLNHILDVLQQTINAPATRHRHGKLFHTRKTMLQILAA